MQLLRTLHFITAIGFFAPLCAKEQRGFFVDAAALYWQAQENGLSDVIANGRHVKNVPFEWDFGFRLGVGYLFSRDAWKIALQFTSLQTHADAMTHGKLIPLWMVSDLAVVESSKMHWRLHLGVLDLLLCRAISISPFLTLEPQIGISSAWVRQKYSVEYRGGLVERESLIRTKNKFSGIGPYFGVAMTWGLGCGFSLFGLADVRGWAGEFYLHQDEDLIASKQKLLGVHNIYPQGAAAFEAIGGVQWGLKWLHVRLSWDHLVFLSQNQLMHFVKRGEFFANQGDLSIRGVELAFHIEF